MDRAAVISLEGLDELVAELRRLGFCVVGPAVRDGAIVYDELESAAELPIGWGDDQEAGTYRLGRRGDGARFGYAAGPHSWKQFLQPARVRLWRARRGGDDVELEEEPPPERPYAFVGVRGCDRRAIEIQDRVLTGGRFADRDYAARRADAFVVAVDCAEPAGTCFCVSMGTGPKAREGFDLALTEVLEDGRHYFTVEVGSGAGEELLAELAPAVAGDGEVGAAARATERAAAQMGREMDVTDIRELLYRNLEHPRWDVVADRCLTCGNCTMVCPTCFCTTVEDVTDLAGTSAERVREWDSCFTMDFSYVHGGSVRA